MFTVLRSVVIIGLIFYFSPARETGHAQREAGGDSKPAQTPPASAGAQDGTLSRLVGSLKEEAVRTVANDQDLADKAFSAGLRMSESAARSLVAQPKPVPAEKPRLAESDWVARADQDPSVRCIYRCDGSE